MCWLLHIFLYFGYLILISTFLDRPKLAYVWRFHQFGFSVWSFQEHPSISLSSDHWNQFTQVSNLGHPCHLGHCEDSSPTGCPPDVFFIHFDHPACNKLSLLPKAPWKFGKVCRMEVIKKTMETWKNRSQVLHSIWTSLCWCWQRPESCFLAQSLSLISSIFASLANGTFAFVVALAISTTWHFWKSQWKSMEFNQIPQILPISDQQQWLSAMKLS